MLKLRVNADLVTMSACSTGQTYVRSNEVNGFVRTFLQWGVPSIIASLWEVNDHATSMLMTSFYQRINDSPDIAENLRLAMLDVKEIFLTPTLLGRIRIDRPAETWKQLEQYQDCPKVEMHGFHRK